MIRKITLGTVALLLASQAVTVSAATEVGLGVEHQNWREYDETGTKMAEVTGPRLALSVKLAQDVPAGLLLSYQGKAYGGQLNYQDQAIGAALDTSAWGIDNEVRVNYRYDFRDSKLDYYVGTGWERWGFKSDMVAGEHRDYFKNAYASLGFNYHSPDRSGWHGGMGVRLSYFSKENRNYQDFGFRNNPKINLKHSFDFMGEVGYRMADPSWDVVAYLETRRFPQSDVMTFVLPDNSKIDRYQRSLKSSVWGVKLMRTL